MRYKTVVFAHHSQFRVRGLLNKRWKFTYVDVAPERFDINDLGDILTLLVIQRIIHESIWASILI
jgi:hypothetical protein